MADIPSPLLPIIYTIILCFAPSISTDINPPPPYLSPTTFPTNYQTMLSTFKIFPYTLLPFTNTNTNTNTNTTTSLFHSSLLSSPLITSDPNSAHLFYLPFPPDLPLRPLIHLISLLRSSSPYWNRSLASDHFFLSSCSSDSAPAPLSSSRNIAELRKNAVRVSCFPAPSGFFVPHKDLSLPPPPLTRSRSPLNPTRPTKYLAFFKTTSFPPNTTTLIEGLRGDPEFMIESQPSSDEAAYVDMLETSMFCLFVHEREEVVGLGEALASGCVPVVITDRPIQDMPLMDVLSWQEIALFVGSGVGHTGLKRVLKEVVGDEGRYERMKRSGVAVAQHFVWNDPPKPYDAFHMVVYQLWLRRHALRYARAEMV